MHPKSNRRVATRTLISRVPLVLALTAALSFIPLREASAQPSGHQGHQSYQGQGAIKPPTSKKKAPVEKRGSAARRPSAHHAHTGTSIPHGGPLGQGAAASTREYQVAHEQMMRNMALPYTGDADVDFRIQMIPHHQGAIDMARVAMRHAKDPWTRQLAEAVIVEQQREIAEMQAWLTRRGAMVPAGGQPTHIMGANSFRRVPEEAGTRSELVGQSWAPGSGVPARQ